MDKERIKSAMLFAVHDMTGKVLREEVLESMVEDFINKNESKPFKSAIPAFQDEEWIDTVNDLWNITK